MDDLQEKSMLRDNGLMLCICLLCLLFNSAYADEKDKRSSDLSINHVTDLLKKSRELSDTMQLPDNVHKKEGKKRAKELTEFYNSEEFQCSISDGVNKLKQGIFKGTIEEYYKGLNDNNNCESDCSNKTIRK